MDVARPQWQPASTGISIIALPESSQAILLKVLDACKLLTVAANTSLQTLNRLPNLIDTRCCEDVPGEAECVYICAISENNFYIQMTDVVHRFNILLQ